MAYILYIPFGLLPSIIWLLFYLKKDAHPESKKMILKVFFYGTIAAIMAAGVQLLIFGIFEYFKIDYLLTYSLSFFLINHFFFIALTEEYFKFFVVKIKTLKDSEFDEPLDAMLYMVIAALGFAALENLLYLFPVLIPKGDISITQAAFISGFRFIGATFLHALASGIVGFFLAYSIFEHKKRWLFLFFGIIIATALHGLFNLSIITMGQGFANKNSWLTISSFVFLIIILSASALLVGLGFKKLRKISSVCKQKLK